MTKATIYLQVNQDLGKVFYYVDVCDIDIGYVELDWSVLTAKLELLLKMWKREATPLPQS
jgi:hypothetical protein